MQDIDGFACLSADKWEYAQDEATRNGREEPNESDMMDGIRRMIDDAMLTQEEHTMDVNTKPNVEVSG